jgi:hypothetical protein
MAPPFRCRLCARFELRHDLAGPPSSPYLAGHLHDAFELAPLVFLADEVARHVGAESALRADGELLALSSPSW